jgi:hypothetical protein
MGEEFSREFLSHQCVPIFFYLPSNQSRLPLLTYLALVIPHQAGIVIVGTGEVWSGVGPLVGVRGRHPRLPWVEPRIHLDVPPTLE